MKIDEALSELTSTTNVKFTRLVHLATVFFGSSRINGSHHVFKTPWKGKPFVNLQKDGSNAKPYQVEQVKKALLKLKEVQCDEQTD